MALSSSQSPTNGAAGRRPAGRPGTASPVAEFALEARAIKKEFVGVVANDGVEFAVRHGEVHGLLGQNGSGKSTLCKILTGLYRPDAGQVLIDGATVTIRSPAEAFQLGVAMVHQHFSLVDQLTVAENIVLGWHDRIRLSKRELATQVSAAAERFGITVKPRAPVWQLAMGERQQVEILKALYRGARILILDEPTAVLAPQEVDQLFASVRELVNNGGTIVFISHKLKEVLHVCDRVTVLRNGQTTGTLDLKAQGGSSVDSNQLANMMMGREVRAVTRADRADEPDDQVVLAVSDVVVQGDVGETAVQSVSLEVRRGEILGIAGVSGNGQRELAEAIYGLRVPVQGTITLDGVPLESGAPRERIGSGIAYVPEDRSGTGLIPTMTVKENMILKSYRSSQYSSGPFINWGKAKTDAEGLISRLDIKAAVETPIGVLSGGNAQKVLLGREIAGVPKLLLICAPTRGLDFAATSAVRELLLDTARQGTAVVMVSEDLDELREICDRVAVMCAGRITGTVDPRATTLEEIGLLMMGHEGEVAA